MIGESHSTVISQFRPKEMMESLYRLSNMCVLVACIDKALDKGRKSECVAAIVDWEDGQEDNSRLDSTCRELFYQRI